MDQRNRFVWWEKTVEYAYLAKTLSHARFAISPLDGNIETNIGDAIALSGLNYGIIEFKRDSASIATEADKYGDGEVANYRDWCEEVMDRPTRRLIREGDEPHSIVFGYLGKLRGRIAIGTVTTRYWWPDQRLRHPKLCHSEIFSLYLGRLALVRNTKSISGSTGGSIFGFDGSGIPVVHIDLESALRTFRPDYDYKNDRIAGPIPGMG
ncbi:MULTISPECIES: hypothetical protein [Agrobacterium]|uniref:hypothetical protein n=1 Tax=Agrobacterium TaxID=357 RepID=UPI000697468D|nr:hypothetical protein [Agrobacterium fabrum]CUX57103.1 hypothetical protein AGR8A_pTi10071 [Agrobacterium fabrum str. J-07]